MEKLSNKTKAQLLDIIDRKDSVERSLRDINTTLNDQIVKLRQLNKDNIQKFNNLKADMDGTCEVLNKTREELDWHKKALEDYKNKTIIYEEHIVEEENDYKHLEKNYKHLEEEYNVLKSDYQNICDILATEKVERKNWKHVYIIIISILCVALFYAIMYIHNI